MAFDRQIGTLVVFCEASGEPYQAQVGVAATQFNRVRAGRWQPSIAGVCLQRAQFSEFNDDRLDNANLLRGANTPDGDKIMLQCGMAWDEAERGADPTGGATHYHDTSIPPPSWTVGAIETCQLGRLVFWKGVK